MKFSIVANSVRKIVTDALSRIMHLGRIPNVLLLALATIAGCADDSNIASVDGIVRLDGQPLTSGTVRFVPAAGRAATGKIQSDGTFTLGTYGESDGALIGTHQVAVIAYDAADDGRPAYEVRTAASKSLVPQRYMAVGTSGLSFDVKPGKNQANLDLTTR
jgi:hypothetical protein